MVRQANRAAAAEQDGGQEVQRVPEAVEAFITVAIPGVLTVAIAATGAAEQVGDDEPAGRAQNAAHLADGDFDILCGEQVKEVARKNQIKTLVWKGEPQGVAPAEGRFPQRCVLQPPAGAVEHSRREINSNRHAIRIRLCERYEDRSRPHRDFEDSLTVADSGQLQCCTKRSPVHEPLPDFVEGSEARVDLGHFLDAETGGGGFADRHDQ